MTLKEAKENAWKGRKWRASWYLTWLFTAMLVLANIASLVVSLITGAKWEICIISADAYVTFIILIWSAFFGASTLQKHKSFESNQQPDDLENKAEVDNWGGQPKGTQNP